MNSEHVLEIVKVTWRRRTIRGRNLAADESFTDWYPNVITVRCTACGRDTATKRDVPVRHRPGTWNDALMNRSIEVFCLCGQSAQFPKTDMKADFPPTSFTNR